MNNNSSIYAGIAALAAVVLIIVAVIFAAKWFNSVTVGTQVVSPQDGVSCLIATSTDGIAVDCWRVQ